MIQLNQTRSKPGIVDRPVRIARTFVHHYYSTQYCSTETVFLIFPFLQQMSHLRCCQAEVSRTSFETVTLSHNVHEFLILSKFKHSKMV